MPADPDRLVERVRAIPRTPHGDRRLAAMLRRDGRPYRGLSTADAEWVRGHVLAAFEHRTATDDVVAALREDLRTSLNPVILAGAARAVRGLGGPAETWRALLDAAAQRLATHDTYVDFHGRHEAPRTAREEIARTLEAVHRCCTEAAPARGDPVRLSLCRHALEPAVIEDQAGVQSSLLDLLRARPSLVAFFYTRCMNPTKCSLTIGRLAAVAARLRGDANVLALSYDGDFDTPPRLLAFGRDRGFPFSGTARLARCPTGWPVVRKQFALDVGYGQSTVNAHGREVFLVSTDLRAEAIDPELLASPEGMTERLPAQV